VTFNERALLHRYLRQVVQPSGAVLVDVGAYVGGWCRPFLQDGWRAYAFEPDDNNRARLLGMCAQFSGLRVRPEAVCDRVSPEAPFYTSPVSDGISGLSKFHPSHVEAQKVSTTTLDVALAEEHVERVDFLKIDTEGHDLPVLRGFPWDRMKPLLVICEFEGRKTETVGYGFDDMASYLVERGYELLVSEWYPIEEYGGQHTWRSFKTYPCELEDADAWGNIIAFRDGIDFLKLMTAMVEVAALEKDRAAAVDADLKGQIEYITGSWSWRLTAPLRRMLKLVKR